MNKKGFTLVELLAVIALIAILMGIAVPNVISTVNNGKRNDFLSDVKRMVAKAEYLVSSNKTDRDYVRSGGSKTYNLVSLNEKGEFDKDADGGSYNASTYVRVTYSGGKYKFCVYALGSKRRVGTATSCVYSEDLTGITVVKDN